MRWHPGLAEAEATLLRISFTARLAVHHSGWESRGEHAAVNRDQYDGGWPATLVAFGAFANNARSAT